MCEVIPFPLAARVDLIERQANRFLDLGPQSCETTLRHQLQLQADVLRRKGVAPEHIARQVRELEAAIRARAWAIVFAPGARG